MNPSGIPILVLEAFAPRAAAELERKRAEDGLVESEQRYRAFIANSPDAMWRIEFEEPIPTGLPEDEQIERIHRERHHQPEGARAAAQRGRQGSRA